MPMEPSTTILCSHRRPRSHPPIWLVCHTNQGPEGYRSARGLAAYTAQHDVEGGYHEVIDNLEVIRTAYDGDEVNGAGPTANDHGWHVCEIGYAEQTSAQWHDPYSLAEHSHLADRLADRCRDFGIPPVLLSPADLRAFKPGICGHDTVKQAFPNDTTHWDPGPSFPWGLVIKATRQRLGLSVSVIQPVRVFTGGVEADMPTAKTKLITLAHQGFGQFRGVYDAGVPVHECQATIHGPEPKADGWWPHTIGATVRAQARGNRVIVTASCPEWSEGQPQPAAHVVAFV